MLHEQGLAGGQLVDFERGWIPGVDLDGPGITGPQDVIDAEPAQEPEVGGKRDFPG